MSGDLLPGDHVLANGSPGVVTSTSSRHVEVRFQALRGYEYRRFRPAQLDLMRERPTAIECAWAAVKANA